MAKVMARLTVTRRRYDVTSLRGWAKRQRNVLSFPPSSEDFAKFLRRKVRSREARTRRFFGEAFVASKTPHRAVFYASFKWLTNPRFAGSAVLLDPEQERFRAALHKHFTGRIEKLQSVANALAKTCRKDLEGIAPTAPDLWIIDKRGRHRFIEVKLPGDSVAPHQLAGMAAIVSVLSGPQKVSVEVIQLHDEERMFKDFWRAAREILMNRNT
jgi:hypothetical protein